MGDNLQRYMPEYDDSEIRLRLEGFSREELIESLLRACREKRLFAKMLDERMRKLARVEEVLHEPSDLLKMPGVPTAEDLKRLMEDE